MALKQKNVSHTFASVPKISIPRSVFDRSAGYKTTFDSGYLVPFFVDEVLPGDTFNLNCSLFARMSTPIVPLMDNLYLETFFFFVPNRLIWDHWENFCGERKNPNDSIDFLIPQATATNAKNGSLWDYFGLPTNVTNKLSVSALPFRAYQLIYNEWFRDENLIDSVAVHLDDSTQDFTSLMPYRRGKRFDYFTSSLPWPQRGQPVDVPINDLKLNYDRTKPLKLCNLTEMHSAGTWQAPIGTEFTVKTAATADQNFPLSAGYTLISGGPSGTQFNSEFALANANMTVTGNLVTVNALRQAFAIQRWQERSLFGTRYIETIYNHFGVKSPDARLQRPEYLGGSSTPISINPVQQTSATISTGKETPQGNLAAYGVVGDNFHGFNKSFVEHGWIVGIVNVRADLTYQQGINRMWSRKDMLDFYWPEFAHLGEQAVLNKEIYAQGTADDDAVFGYQERYGEYRYRPSLITGKLRSSDPQSLDVWHLAQEFSSLPKLNQAFIEDNPPVARALAVQNEPQFIFDSVISLKCIRPMPVYGIPGIGGHF